MRNIIYISVICLLILSSSVGHADVNVDDHKQVGKSNSAGLTWRFAYDDAGRITKFIDQAGRQTKFLYELDNNKRV
jgi:YD repeat-containing protein